eukprot:TRINITY_DN1756_c0_g2_i1.p1 TRINITY_DN1756_c0_g2~~TRINITY_DN1756_c0_g2_i1.p1  ORF type:complete len:424 (-),score=5.84 TRINITY_DN1756_c0_g2_i1:357-1496(-)
MSAPKKRIFKIENAKRFFWYEITGVDTDYIMLKGNMFIKDIKVEVYKKLPELLKTKYGANNENSLTLIHNGKVLKNDIIVLGDASTIYSGTHPAIVSWPDSENLVRLIKAFERLEKPLLPSGPLQIAGLCQSPILSNRLLGLIDKGKYIPYLSTKEIAENVKTLKANMKKQSLTIDTEAGVANALYMFLNHALLETSQKTSHIAHIKIGHEWIIEQEFYNKKILYKADLVIYDAIEEIVLFITQAKLKKSQDILDAVRQNVEQLRLYTVAQSVRKVYGIATTYSDWVIIHYECNPDDEETVEMTNLVSIGPYQDEIVGNVEHLIKLLRATLCLAYEAKSVYFVQFFTFPQFVLQTFNFQQSPQSCTIKIKHQVLFLNIC